MFELKNVSKSFRLGKALLWAVDGVDLIVAEGKTHALVGESGCGKSTLAKLMLAIEEPTSGEILFEGKEMRNFSRKELFAFRRKVQMVFQDPYGSLNPRMKVGDIIGEPLDIHKLADGSEREESIGRLLERVGLPLEAMGRYPREFSGGQRQRISIARALAVSPSLIVADEPLSALDVSVQAQILLLLDTLKREEKLSYLLISHDLRVVEYISESVTVMYLGKVMESGETDKVFGSPAHPYTKALLDTASRGGSFRIQGDTPSPVARPKGCFFHPRCPLARGKCKTEMPSLEMNGHSAVRCHFPLL